MIVNIKEIYLEKLNQIKKIKEEEELLQKELELLERELTEMASARQDKTVVLAPNLLFVRKEIKKVDSEKFKEMAVNSLKIKGVDADHFVNLASTTKTTFNRTKFIDAIKGQLEKQKIEDMLLATTTITESYGLKELK